MRPNCLSGLLAVALLALAFPAHASGGGLPDPVPEASPDGGMGAAMGHAGEHSDDAAPGPMSTPLQLGHARDGSGTSWQPDTTPMHGFHIMAGEWMVMIHGQLEAGFVDMGGRRGDNALIVPNWVMGMASHAMPSGLLQARLMLSLEPLGINESGYPLMLQTGETFKGVTLHDRQHPHDLFMEIALRYSRAFGHGMAFEIYAGPAGEPALGPSAFPHRESAALDPLAPITHHHLDSTHVSFGVLTAGFYNRFFKLEASIFNGREPDEHRFGLDLAGLDSYSMRLSAAPFPWLTAQISYGHLTAPEALEPELDQERLTASTTIDLPLGADGNWAGTLAFGRTIQGTVGTNGVLAESNFDLDGHHNVFGRFEWVQRTAEDLVLDPALTGAGPFDVEQASLGYLYEFDPSSRMRLGLGALGMLSFVPTRLENTYGGSAEPGLMIFIRIRPDRLGM